MKFIPIVAFLVVLIAQFAWSGQIEIWEDDEGVTHIEYHKSKTQKTSLSTHQESNRQYKDYRRKMQQRKSEYQRKQENLIRKMQQRKSEIQRKYEAKIRKIRRETDAHIRKQKALSQEYKKKIRSNQRVLGGGGDAVTRNKDNRNITQTTGTIMGNCTREWGNNHRMVEYCVNKQTEAQKAIIGKSGIIRDNCEKEWGDNYRMVDYCINKQETAKQNIEHGYSGDKLSFCKEKWGNNYRMVEYCLNCRWTEMI